MPTKTASWISVTPYRVTAAQRTPRREFSGGTHVLAVVTSDKADLVFFDTERSRLDLYVDSQGRDLAKRRGQWSCAVIWSYPDHAMYDDGKTVCVDFSSPQIPAKGARWLRAEGALVFRVGLEWGTIKNEPVKLSTGGTVDAGVMKLHIGRDRHSGNPASIAIEGEGRAYLIRGFRVLNTAGEKIASHRDTHGFVSKDIMERPEWATVDLSLSVPKEIDEVVVEVDFWASTEEVLVPFDYKVGLGLGDPDEETTAETDTDTATE